MTLKSICFISLIMVLICGCKHDPLDVDASNVEMKIDFVNVHSTLMNEDSSQLMASHSRFKNEITDIYSFEIGECMRIGKVSDTAFYNSIKLFRKDTTIQKLENSISKAFSDKNSIEEKVINGFKHLKYHFPNGNFPKHVVYLNSLFVAGVFCTEDDIGVGLERFLGDSSEVVKRLNPQYHFDWMKKAMDATYLERDILTGWIETHFVDVVDGNLANKMIRWGKIIYLTEAAFPDDPPERIIRYSKEDYQWALDNEFAFWEYLVNEKLLFKINERDVMNMLNEGPFTPGLPDQDGPDRLGQFLGWQMVKMYMDKNDSSLKDLIDIPYNDILQEYEIE